MTEICTLLPSEQIEIEENDQKNMLIFINYGVHMVKCFDCSFIQGTNEIISVNSKPEVRIKHL